MEMLGILIEKIRWFEEKFKWEERIGIRGIGEEKELVEMFIY